MLPSKRVKNKMNGINLPNKNLEEKQRKKLELTAQVRLLENIIMAKNFWREKVK